MVRSSSHKLNPLSSLEANHLQQLNSSLPPFLFLSISMSCGFEFSMLADASGPALERVETAKKAFLTAKANFEQNTLPYLQIGTKYEVRSLLRPQCHLTSKTWPIFRNWVENQHPGWRAKRRAATAGESVGKPGRSGKAYWTDCFYQDPSTLKPRKKRSKKRVENADQKPAAADTNKKFKSGPASIKPKFEYDGPFAFESLPEPLQLVVLSFSDVPTLGALVLVSKRISALAKRDDMWAHHLNYLQQQLFDTALENDPHPLSQREDWQESKAFLRWWSHPRQNRRALIDTVGLLDYVDDFRQNPKAYGKQEMLRFKWLFVNVNLREYYHRAGVFALDGVEQHYELMADSNRCPHCLEKIFFGCNCDGGDASEDIFVNMPRIRMFLRARTFN